MGQYTGKVVWFNEKKGFGFVAVDGDDKDLFVHYSNINCEGFKTLVADQLVTFDIGKNDRGPQAICVEVINENEENR